ncbi:hypothetical protein [uncultured Serinicoccus sp.]|uniref:hypothetical protein n=1 Tax=uncultured Serinicoccus sp. TaxID=735514 RepID=UPI00260EAA2C|nr:hypothetical protein [uncultured Serinicoccus sp.]
MAQGTLANGRTIDIVREGGFTAMVDCNVGGLNPKPAVIAVQPGQQLEVVVSLNMMGGVTAKEVR